MSGLFAAVSFGSFLAGLMFIIFGEQHPAMTALLISIATGVIATIKRGMK